MTSLNFTVSGHPTKRKARQESDVQKECWAWLATVSHNQDGNKPLQDFSYMVPNGTQLGGSHKGRARYMASLKAQGFRPGVSDIVIARPKHVPGSMTKVYHGAYIELKKEPDEYGGPKAVATRKSAVRPEQRAWLKQQAAVGYWVAIAWGTEDFKRLVGLFLAGESPEPLDWDERVRDTESAQ